MNHYFGTYECFETPSKKEAAVLLGADNMIGDAYEIDFVLKDDTHTAWLINRFNQKVGFFKPKFSRQLSIYKAQGLTLTALLSYVAYTDTPDPGHYWGEAAVFAYDKNNSEAFAHYIDNIARRLRDGIRPQIDCNETAVAHIIESGGEWISNQTLPQLKPPQGTVILKSHQSMSDRLIEQGRKGNKGCYVVSWIFLLALVFIILWILHSLGLF